MASAAKDNEGGWLRCYGRLGDNEICEEIADVIRWHNDVEVIFDSRKTALCKFNRFRR